MKLLLASKNINPNVRSIRLLNGEKKYKKTVLHLAIEKENVEIVELLLSCQRLDLNLKSIYQSYDRWNNLKRSSTFFSKIVNTLLLPFTDGKQIKKKTPLHLAVIKNNYDIIKLLLNNEKCNISIVDESGKTPLDYAESDEIKKLFNFKRIQTSI